LNGQDEAIAGLTLSGGSVTAGAGTLTLGGNVAALTSARVPASAQSFARRRDAHFRRRRRSSDSKPCRLRDHQRRAGSAGIIQTSGGQLTLSGANTYTGPTTLSGVVTLGNDSALGAGGSAANGTTVNPGGLLLVSGANIGNEFLTLGSGVSFNPSAPPAGLGRSR